MGTADPVAGYAKLLEGIASHPVCLKHNWMILALSDLAAHCTEAMSIILSMLIYTAAAYNAIHCPLPKTIYHLQKV